MKGRTVQVFLRTPLIEARYDGDPEQRQLGGVWQIVGEVIDERPTGLHLKVSELRSPAGAPLPRQPFTELVLPGSKIDHVALVDD